MIAIFQVREILTNAQAGYPQVTCDASRIIASTATCLLGDSVRDLTPFPWATVQTLLRASTFAHSRNTARGKRGILFCYAADKTREYMLTVALACI